MIFNNEFWRKYLVEKKGFIYIGLTYVLWGFLPLYWKMIVGLKPMMIFSYRIVMSLVLVMAILFYRKQVREFFGLLKDFNTMKRLVTSSLLISINWYLFIYAVTTGNILQSSMGYYMTPLVMILIGIFILREKMARYEKMAVIFAAIGIGIMIFKYGEIPYIALGLALSFAFYGLVKKTSKVNYMLSLGWETGIVLPIVLFIIFKGEVAGDGLLAMKSQSQVLLIAFSGVMTAVPLMLYGKGAPMLSMTSLGFMQFIAPTIQFFLAITVGGETLGVNDLISFGGIWIGLVVFSVGKMINIRKVKY
jgi:chloramphenicol-sensitive protein RarD